MSPTSANDLDRNVGALEAEKSLRLIASLPAPEGLEERVKAGLRAAPKRSAVIAWPSDGRRWMQSAGMRAAAVAAIVLVIAGGGWGVYSHIQVAPSAAVAPSTLSSGGFNSAGARRTPKTLERPVVAAPVTVKEKQSAAPSARKPGLHARPVTKPLAEQSVR